MHLLAITPIRVNDAELDRRQARYDKLSPPGIEVELVNLPDDDSVPRTLESAADIEASDRLVATVALEYGAGADALLPDCVLDPGIDVLARAAATPVHGVLRLATAALAGCGLRFGAVTRNRAIADELERRIALYGFASWFEHTSVIDLDFDAIADHARWNDALGAAEAELAPTGARAILNGCSAVDIDRAGSLPVVDPTAVALQALAVADHAGFAARAVR
jgi:Asp/Glu/hydantoin racemase